MPIFYELICVETGSSKMRPNVKVTNQLDYHNYQCNRVKFGDHQANQFVELRLQLTNWCAYHNWGPKPALVARLTIEGVFLIHGAMDFMVDRLY